MTIENQLRALLFFFFFFLIKPRFSYTSAGLMRSAAHGDASMMLSLSFWCVREQMQNNRDTTRYI